jgi:hypothetical protein
MRMANFSAVHVCNPRTLPPPCRYDRYAFDRMYDGAMGTSAAKGSLAQLTFLRMGNLFLDNWDAFNAFMAKMHPSE